MELLVDIPPGDLTQPQPQPGSAPVNIGVFISVSSSVATTPWATADAIDDINAMVIATNDILAQCKLHLVVEAAQVVVLPEDLMNFKGNEPGSYGGHPPADTPNPRLFNYQQNERLTEDALDVFGYGKRYTSRNTIAAFTVREIEYYSGGSTTPTGAGGLSFPPNNHHAAEDYPMRNSVLLVPTYGAAGDLPTPVRDLVLAHELGHMLLNNGGHEADTTNLMSGRGTDITDAQCATMNANLTWLYGDEAVPDPGPPS